MSPIMWQPRFRNLVGRGFGAWAQQSQLATKEINQFTTGIHSK